MSLTEAAAGSPSARVIQTGLLHTSGAENARQRFVQNFAQHRRERRMQWVIGLCVLILLIGVSAVLGEVDLVHL